MTLNFDTPVALNTRKLTLAYDGTVIINDLDLAIPAGKNHGASRP